MEDLRAWHPAARHSDPHHGGAQRGHSSLCYIPKGVITQSPAEKKRAGRGAEGGREGRTRRINPPHTVSERLLETVMDSDTIAGLTKCFPASALSAKHTRMNPDVGLIRAERRIKRKKKKGKRKISLPSSSETVAKFFRDQG